MEPVSDHDGGEHNDNEAFSRRHPWLYAEIIKGAPDTSNYCTLSIPDASRNSFVGFERICIASTSYITVTPTMLRSAALRTLSVTRTGFRKANSSRILLPAYSNARYRSLSTAAGDAARKQLSKKLVDWDGPKLTYEQVRSRTQQPSPVCIS